MSRRCQVALIFVVVLTLVQRASSAAEPISAAPVTFNKDIAPLMFENCATCHHPGEVAPFSLLSYDDAKKRAKQIKELTKQGSMPPWKGVAGHGKFIDERRLAPAEIELIARWVEQGAVEGAAGDLPPAPKFSDGWKLGKPDIVITMPEPYAIPADGPDIYRNFVFPLTLPAGKFIKAAEFRPGNRRIVHHAVLAMDVVGKGQKDDEADPAPGYKGSLNFPGPLFPGSLSAWTPGRDPLPLPEGISLPWKAGMGFILQLHLHPSGKPESEQTSVGFYLTDEPPQRAMVDITLINRKIDIPPGERAYQRRDEFTLPIAMELRGLFPHMHLIGRDFKLLAQPPGGGAAVSLLWINDWDFNWQNYYEYVEPVRLPAGTQIVMETIHDNSAENFRNPNQPPQRVTWGEETTNEMSAAILQFAPTNEKDLDKLLKEQGKRVIGMIRPPQTK